MKDGDQALADYYTSAFDVNKKIDEIHRMLKWMVIECIPVHKRKGAKQPDISDILGEK